MSDAGSADPERAGTIRLQLLGPVGLWSADGSELRAVLQQPKRLALLAYLALATRSGFIRRDVILGVFWTELDQEHARSALRQALHFLRSALGLRVIENRGDELRIRPGSLWCDAAAFQAAIGEGRLEDALALYQNELLPGLFVMDAPEFERWLEIERDRLRRLAVDAAWRLAEEAADAGSGPGVHWARRAVALTPMDEPAFRRLLNYLERGGDRAGALQAYAAFRQRLDEEYGLAPSPETRALIGRMREAANPPSASDEEDVDRIAPPGSRAARVRNDRESPTAGGPAPPTRTTAPVGDGANVRDSPADAGRRVSQRLLALAGALLSLVAIVMAALSILMRQPGPHSPDGAQDLVVISPFEILDPRFDIWGEGLMRVLAANLDGAGPLRTVSPTVALSHWNGGYDRDSATRLGRATHAAAAVTGSVIGAGKDSVRIIALLVDPAGGRQQATVEVRGTDDHMDLVTDSLTVALLREMGRTRPIGAARAAAVGSRSVPALKAFLRGEQLYRRTQWDSALAFYRQAVELDSTFAPALRRVGNVLSWQGVAGGQLAREYHLRAGRFNHGLAPRDSLLVLADSLAAALFAFDDDPDWWMHARRHTAVLVEAGRRYPDDPEIWYAVGEAGFHFRTTVGISSAEMLASFDRAIQLDSSFAPAYLHPISIAMAAGDSTRAFRYARGYMLRAHDDVTTRAIAIFQRTIEHHAITAADSALLARTSEPAELFEAWVPLSEWPDPGESGLRIARWLAARRWADPPPFSDAAFNRNRLARSFAARGHLIDALRIAGASDPALFAELVWLGAVPDAEARSQFEQWLADDNVDAVRGGLPFWAASKDTSAIRQFIQRRTALPAGVVTDSAQERIRSDRAAFDVASGRAWLALANADTAAALDLFLALPDSLCPPCYLHRIPRAELLLRTDHAAEARERLDRELTAIVGGPRPTELLWRLLRAEAAERTGDSATAAAIRRRVSAMWRNADSVARQVLLARSTPGPDR